MSGTSSSPPPASDDDASDVTAIQSQAQQLRGQLDALKKEQRATRSTLVVMTLVLGAILVVFGVALYATVTTNLSADKLEPVLIERAEAHAPRLRETFAEAVSLAMPMYRDLALERIEAIGPALRADATAEFEQLPAAIETKLRDRMDAMRDRIEQRTTEAIRERFDFLDDAQVERLTLHFTDRLIAAGERIEHRQDEIYNRQLDRLENVLAKFDTLDTDAMSAQELQYKVIENVALLVVYLVQNPDELPAYPAVAEGDVR